MKKLLLSIFAFSLSISVFCASYKIADDSLASYRAAIDYYENNEYGKALKYSEDAITIRKQQVEHQLNVLTNSLSSRRVKRAGESIEQILKVLEERNEFESIAIINYYLEKNGKEDYEDSISKLMVFIKESSDFPEAHKLIGDIYKLEGEYEFAENYYSLALSNSDVLDIPDQKYDILYMLAEISKLEDDFPKMETRLLNILVNDKCFMDTALSNAMVRTISSDSKDSMEKFFTLYRADSYYSIKAYNELTQYYYDQGVMDKALQFSALSVSTGFTRIISVLESRDSEFEYVNLEHYFSEASKYSDILEWGNANQIWQSYNQLAKISRELGYTKFAQQLLRVIVKYGPQDYWQKDAVLQLQMIE